MTLKLYPTPGDFLRDNQDYLARFEASTQLNQGNAFAHEAESCHPGLLFGRYEQDGQALLLFGNTSPWNLCLNAPHMEDPAPALAASQRLAEELRAKNVPIAGVTGREALCQAFMRSYGGEFQVRSTLDIMVLHKLIDPPPVEGQVRPATMDELDALTNWMCAFMEEALHEPADWNVRREACRKRIEDGSRWVLEAPDGTLLSTVSTSRRMAHSIGITAVYTSPEHRGKGYCQFAVASLCRKMLAAGFEACTLFVDKKNPVSNRVYKKIGFEILEDSSEYKLLKMLP